MTKDEIDASGAPHSGIRSTSLPSKEVALAPCPFCGGEPSIRKRMAEANERDFFPPIDRALAALQSVQPPGREALTDDQVEKAILKFAREHSRVFPLTYESGQYEITKATGRAVEFARAILSLVNPGDGR